MVGRQLPFFSLGVLGATVPALKLDGEIGQQITGIQAATQESVGAIKEISGTIEKLSEISSTIAAAVEERAFDPTSGPRTVDGEE